MSTWRQKLERVCRQVRTELIFYRLVLGHPRTPRAAKWCLAIALAYLVAPIDLIPDFIPVLGHLDDLLIVPFFIWAARALVPAEVMVECRTAATPLSSRTPAAPG